MGRINHPCQTLPTLRTTNETKKTRRKTRSLLRTLSNENPQIQHSIYPPDAWRNPSMTNGLLSPFNGIPTKIAFDREVENLIYKTWQANTDKCGVLTHTMRSMRRMPTRQFSTLGNSLPPRIKESPIEFVYYAYLR